MPGVFLCTPDAPVLDNSTDKVAVDINQSAVLLCAAHSVPGATFRWFKDDIVLTSGGHVKIDSSTVSGEFLYQSTVNITRVDASDLGMYRCEATNSLGQQEIYLNLTVRSKGTNTNTLLSIM